MPVIPFLDQLTLPLLLGCLWGIASWGWPVASVILMPLFFPLYLVKFSILGVPFTFVEWFIYVSFFTHFLKNLYLSRRHREGIFTQIAAYFRKRFGKKTYQDHPHELHAYSLWVPITLMVISVIISIFVVPDALDRKEVFGILKGWFIAPVMYFYLIIHVLPGLKSIRRCLEWYTISAVLLSVWGIAQWVSHATITLDGRVSGPFVSANYLALYIMPAVIFVAIRVWHMFFVTKEYNGVVGLFMKVFHAEEKISYLALSRYVLAGGIILFALYLTRSFGAFLGLSVALITYAIYHWFFSYWRMERKTALLRLIAFGLGVAFIAGVFFVTGDPGKFKQMFNFTGRSSSSVRVEVWTVAKKLIEEHPVLGIGPGRFEDEYTKRAPQILGKAPYEPNMLHPHNLLLMFWLSSGILGLVSFLWLIYLLFYTVFWLDKHDGRKRLAVICGAMLLGILVHGLVDTPLWKNDLALQFWMIAGIIGRLRYE